MAKGVNVTGGDWGPLIPGGEPDPYLGRAMWEAQSQYQELGIKPDPDQILARAEQYRQEEQDLKNQIAEFKEAKKTALAEQDRLRKAREKLDEFNRQLDAAKQRYPDLFDDPALTTDGVKALSVVLNGRCDELLGLARSELTLTQVKAVLMAVHAISLSIAIGLVNLFLPNEWKMYVLMPFVVMMAILIWRQNRILFKPFMEAAQDDESTQSTEQDDEQRTDLHQTA